METNLLPRVSPIPTRIRSGEIIVVNERAPLLDNDSIDDENLQGTPISPPPDKFSLVYAVFFFLGMSTLLPWNFFISLNNFWDYKFRFINETLPDNDGGGKNVPTGESFEF